MGTRQEHDLKSRARGGGAYLRGPTECPSNNTDALQNKHTFKNSRVGYDSSWNSSGGVCASASIFATTTDDMCATWSTEQHKNT